MKPLALGHHRKRRRRHKYRPQPERSSHGARSSGDLGIYQNVHAKIKKEKDDESYCVLAGRTYLVIGVVGKIVIVQVICARKIELSATGYS